MMLGQNSCALVYTVLLEYSLEAAIWPVAPPLPKKGMVGGVVGKREVKCSKKGGENVVAKRESK